MSELGAVTVTTYDPEGVLIAISSAEGGFVGGVVLEPREAARCARQIAGSLVELVALGLLYRIWPGIAPEPGPRDDQL